MADLIFPTSSAPGQRPGEGGGRLINCHVVKEGDAPNWRRAPGLTADINTTLSTPRGMAEYNGHIFAAYSGAIAQRTTGGTLFSITGSLPGTDPVTFARNIKQPTSDVIVCRSSGGAYVLNVGGGSVAAHPDADLPATVNSVDSLSGFFLYTNPADAKIYASDFNTTAQNALSYATAESRADALIRGVTFGDTYLAFGAASIEPWKNVGSTPFPLARHTTVIPVGLLSFGAVAGTGLGWDRNLLFVSHNRTVCELRGYNAVRVSTPAVERFIEDSTTSTLVAFVYTTSAGAFWVLSSDAGTWEYNTTTGAWAQRQSATGTGWRAKYSAKAGDTWFVGDTLSTSLLKVDPDAAVEGSAALTFEVESAGLKEYPARYTISAVLLDVTRSVTGNGEFAFSRDGGASWSAWRTFDFGAGAKRGPLRFNGLGLAQHDGLRVKVRVSDPVMFSLLGGTAEIAERRP
jgi:hypothetical protein